MAAAVERHAELTRPPGSLGKLEGLGVWLAGVQGSCPPRGLVDRRLVLLAGDHGIAAAGVSAYPPGTTARMVEDVLSGDAPVNVLARLAGARIQAVDLSLAEDGDGIDRRYKVRAGSGRIDVEPALTPEETLAALRAGVALADAAVDEGADVLVAAELGIGHTTIAAAVVCAVTGAEPVEVVGHGSGISTAAWGRQVSAVRDALRRSRASSLEPVRLLTEITGADVAAMVGLLLGAAARRTPVVLDGVVSGAAALVAQLLAPPAAACWVAGHLSAEPVHARTLAHLRLVPLLDLHLRLGEATGALLALPLLEAAGAVLREGARTGH